MLPASHRSEWYCHERKSCGRGDLQEAEHANRKKLCITAHENNVQSEHNCTPDNQRITKVHSTEPLDWNRHEIEPGERG